MRTQKSRRMLLGLVGAATVAALVMPGAAFAKGPGGGGGGGGGEETAGFSLSVPAVFVGGVNGKGLTCNGTASDPTGVPDDGFTIDPAAYYYVQGVNKWQAGCLEAIPAATATAAWGDNLSGDAKLKVGSPIRVEIGLFAAQIELDGELAAVPSLTGWTVVKLEPNMLDREAPYGTLAAGDLTNGFVSYPVTPYPETRAWAAGATLKIYPKDSPSTPVYDGSASAEINATGRIVYGYNLRVQSIGTYVIEYTFPGVSITGVDAGGYEGSTATLEITVVGGGGGGGGKGRP